MPLALVTSERWDPTIWALMLAGIAVCVLAIFVAFILFALKQAGSNEPWSPPKDEQPAGDAAKEPALH